MKRNLVLMQISLAWFCDVAGPVRTSRQLMECRLLRADLRQKGVSFVATGRAAEWGEAMPDVSNRTVIADTRREPTETFFSHGGVAGGVNAGVSPSGHSADVWLAEEGE